MNRAERPSILLFFPDQHRHDWIGAGRQTGVRTPNLDALARRGVRLAPDDPGAPGFGLQTDPHETHNIAPAAPEVAERLSAAR